MSFFLILSLILAPARFALPIRHLLPRAVLESTLFDPSPPPTENFRFDHHTERRVLSKQTTESLNQHLPFLGESKAW